MLLASLVGYLGLLDLGVRGAITRFVAQHHAVGDHAGASRVIVAALRLFVVLGGIAILLSVLLAVFVDRLFTVPPELLRVARIIIPLGGVSIAVSFLGGVFGGIVAGLHRFDVDSALEIGVTALRTILVIAAIQAGLGLLDLALIQFGVGLLRGVANVVAAFRLYPELSLRGIGPVNDTIRAVLSFSLFSSVIHISTVVLYYSDSLLISAVLPIGMITFFAIAMNLTEYARSICDSVARIVTPRASAADAADGPVAAGDVLLRVGQWTSLIVIPVAMTFILRGETFINLWMGPEYGPVSGPILMLLGLTVWLAGGRSVAVAGLIGVNRHRGLAAAYVVEAVVNISLALLLIPRFGLLGVAVGAAAPSVLASLFFLPWYVGRSVGVARGAFARQVWLLPTIAALPFGVATYLVELVWPAGSIVGFFAQVALLLPLVALGGALVLLPAARAARLVSDARALLPWRRPSGEARA